MPSFTERLHTCRVCDRVLPLLQTVLGHPLLQRTVFYGVGIERIWSISTYGKLKWKLKTYRSIQFWWSLGLLCLSLSIEHTVRLLWFMSVEEPQAVKESPHLSV